MSNLKKILENTLGQVREDEATGTLTAATPQNKHSTSFSLLQNIHGNEITTGDVTNHLTQVDAAEEEVDTVAFGLETTDGKIVKVYVNADQADAFEEKMSQLLGKIDDIDQALEELSDEFDIVNVVKPDDMESEGGEEVDPAEVEKGIENQLDEPLGDDDIVTDIESDDMVNPEEEDGDDKKDDKKKDKKKDDESDEEGEDDKDDDPAVDGLDFGLEPEEDADKDAEDQEEGDEDESEEDKGKEEGDDEDESDEDEEGDDDTDPDKKPKKKKKQPKEKDSDVKEEGQSMLKYFVSLNEAKHKSAVPKAEKKAEEPKVKHDDEDESADIFALSLTKDEQELEKIFTTPVQKLIFRVIILLGVNSDQISIRKFKVRKSVKEIATMIQNHPQIKNILSKLGRDLASRKGEIHAINEAEDKDEHVAGTIKDQLSTEISKKLYSLILALGVPEFLLTYKKTAFRNRIKNLSKIAIKHTRIKTYIYMLCDLLKAGSKSGLKESYEQVKAEKAEVVIVEPEEPKYVSKSMLEDFSSTKNQADLGTFSVVSMGEVGGTTIKVKDFSAEFAEDQFEKLQHVLKTKKGGVVKSENLGKVNIIPQEAGASFVIKKVKPGSNDKYPFGVCISKKSVVKILG